MSHRIGKLPFVSIKNDVNLTRNLENMLKNLTILTAGCLYMTPILMPMKHKRSILEALTRLMRLKLKNSQKQ